MAKEDAVFSRLDEREVRLDDDVEVEFKDWFPPMQTYADR